VHACWSRPTRCTSLGGAKHKWSLATGSSRGRGTFLDHEDVWDEEKADEEVDGDGLTPALQALADVLAGNDLAAMLTSMRSGESAELRCQNGTIEIVRDC
jgi:hypothetical protein